MESLWQTNEVLHVFQRLPQRNALILTHEFILYIIKHVLSFFFLIFGSMPSPTPLDTKIFSCIISTGCYCPGISVKTRKRQKEIFESGHIKWNFSVVKREMLVGVDYQGEFLIVMFLPAADVLVLF